MPPQNQTGSTVETSDTGLPLPTLLSHALVAFTIEFDNEVEHRMPHRTTKHRSGYGAWLVSMVMYLNCMRFVGDEGMTLGELEELARTPTNLNGMQRWGYVFLEPPPGGSPSRRPSRDWIIRPTIKGKVARQAWRPLFGEIEERWRKRFGRDEVNRLREALSQVVSQLDSSLPDCLPILGYGLRTKRHEKEQEAKRREDGFDKAYHRSASDMPLPTLLSKVLLAFAIDFESESELALAIGANILRVLDTRNVRVRDLPQLSGVSKEAISMATGLLEKKKLLIIETDPSASRTKIACLTPLGQHARRAYRQLLQKIEDRWSSRFGEDKMRELRESLRPLSGEPLFRGLEPYPEGWRAALRRPVVLPHYPMVLHRGGYPDGS